MKYRYFVSFQVSYISGHAFGNMEIVMNLPVTHWQDTRIMTEEIIKTANKSAAGPLDSVKSAVILNYQLLRIEGPGAELEV